MEVAPEGIKNMNKIWGVITPEAGINLRWT